MNYRNEFRKLLKEYIEILIDRPFCYNQEGFSPNVDYNIMMFEDDIAEANRMDNIKEEIKNLLVDVPDKNYEIIYDEIIQKYFSKYPNHRNLILLSRIEYMYVAPYLDRVERVFKDIDRRKETDKILINLDRKSKRLEKWFNEDLSVLIKGKKEKIIFEHKLSPKNLDEIFDFITEELDLFEEEITRQTIEDIFNGVQKEKLHLTDNRVFAAFFQELYDQFRAIPSKWKSIFAKMGCFIGGKGATITQSLLQAGLDDSKRTATMKKAPMTAIKKFQLTGFTRDSDKPKVTPKINIKV